jgi:hypothetical protein
MDCTVTAVVRVLTPCSLVVKYRTYPVRLHDVMRQTIVIFNTPRMAECGKPAHTFVLIYAPNSTLNVIIQTQHAFFTHPCGHMLPLADDTQVSLSKLVAYRERNSAVLNKRAQRNSSVDCGPPGGGGEGDFWHRFVFGSSVIIFALNEMRVPLQRC